MANIILYRDSYSRRWSSNNAL